jgi:predicted nucleic acid-binding Zn ribbon protein
MQSLQQAMADLEASSQWRSQALLRNILRVWPQVVGTAVAQHSRPTGLQKQVLQVRVTSAAWSQTLTFERLQILDKLRLHLPPAAIINDIRFSSGRWSTSTPSLLGDTVFANHPSRLATAIAPPQRDRPDSAIAAFSQWQHHLSQQNDQHPPCPHCHCPCPPGELARWSVCSICATHQWQSTLGQARDRERSQP